MCYYTMFLFHDESDVAHQTHGFLSNWEGGYQDAFEYYTDGPDQDPYYFSSNDPRVEFPDQYITAD